jgi:putative nucleotidyltransferase with HDIG domain
MEQEHVKAVKAWFFDYCRLFYSQDEGFQRNILLKENHTRNVCANSAWICREELLDDDQTMLAEVIALLHDVGRFEQYRQFRTFKDSISVNHAELGAQILEDYEVLAPFFPHERSVIAHAVELHNVYAVPGKTPEDEKFFLNIIRDADKLDIWRVFLEYFNQPEHMRASAAGLGLPDRPACSPVVLDRLVQQKMVRLSSVKTLNDFKLMQLSWVYDLNFAASFRLLFERDDITRLVATLPESKEVAAAVQVVLEFARQKLSAAAGPVAMQPNGIFAGQ